MSLSKLTASLFTLVSVAFGAASTSDLPQGCMELGNCRGLIVVDFQNDFILPDGSLTAFGTEGTNALLDGLSSQDFQDRGNNFVEVSLRTGLYDFIIYSIDYHPGADEEGNRKIGTPGVDYHCSFEEGDGIFKPIENPDQCEAAGKDKINIGWPAHCMQGTNGAKVVGGMSIPKKVNSIKILDTFKRDDRDEALKIMSEVAEKEGRKTPTKEQYLRYLDAVFADKKLIDTGDKKMDIFWIFKGMNPKVDSFSSFIENNDDRTQLFNSLEEAGYTSDVTTLDVFGVAYDYCVKYTALDARVTGNYKVRFITDLTAPIQDIEQTNGILRDADVELIDSKTVLAQTLFPEQAAQDPNQRSRARATSQHEDEA